MELLNQIRAAGIVGCGGAGFLTHAKLDCKAEYLLINGAECEPLLRTDHWLMRHKAKEIVETVGQVGALVGARNMYIVLKETYAEEIASLRAAIKAKKSKVELFLSPNFYPAGDEQIMVCEVTGRTVPPLGTPLSACIEAAGGPEAGAWRLLVGGPLMGQIYPLEQAGELYVTKTTGGVVLVPEDSGLVKLKERPVASILHQAKTSCIQCSYCTQLCPRYLIGHPLHPHLIMRKVAYAEDLTQSLHDPELLHAQMCSECGVCETYACPMGLAPRQVNRLVKKALAEAGIRCPKPEETFSSREEREWRRAPSKRIAARLGVAQYYDLHIDELAEVTPNRVVLATKQHIGAPARPVVKAGDPVTCGQLIAAAPETGLGVNLHASVDGVVTGVTEAQITIERSAV